MPNTKPNWADQEIKDIRDGERAEAAYNKAMTNTPPKPAPKAPKKPPKKAMGGEVKAYAKGGKVKRGYGCAIKG